MTCGGAKTGTDVTPGNAFGETFKRQHGISNLLFGVKKTKHPCHNQSVSSQGRPCVCVCVRALLMKASEKPF